MPSINEILLDGGFGHVVKYAVVQVSIRQFLLRERAE